MAIPYKSTPPSKPRPAPGFDNSAPREVAGAIDPVAATPAEAARLMRQPNARELGRFADSPTDIAWIGWRVVIRRTLTEMLTDRVALVAAGCAFYATLALFPAISMLISVYGLAFDRNTVLPQLAVLQDLLPPSAYHLIADRITTLVDRPPGTLGWRLVASTAITLWSAASGTKSLMAALNLAYEERETRSFFKYQAVAFTITVCVILGTVLGLAFLVAVPAMLNVLGAGSHQQFLIRLGSFLALMLAVVAGLAALYRYAPNRRAPRWQWVTPGSLVATALWVLVSALFSWYVGTFSTYDIMYGPLGTGIAFMMWFYVTAYAVLLGAELNAELELQTGRDSTNGPPKPIGQRGAYVADHVAEANRR